MLCFKNICNVYILFFYCIYKYNTYMYNERIKYLVRISIVKAEIKRK